MLDISESIANLENEDISDNLLYYSYNVKHLLKLYQSGMPKDDPLYLSAYRSFEGEVYENFMFEKLLRYSLENENVEKFVLKGFHQNRTKAHANTLSISEKRQIVYRTKSREISEFDALLFTKNELYFVEMTLVKSAIKLKKRLRKKKALLETIFPNYEIKALIILNEGTSGTKQFPSYCKIWFTKEFSAEGVLEHILDPHEKQLAPKERMKSPKLVEAHSLELYPFRYYNTINWITKSLRANKNYLVDINFLLTPKVQRFHDLYNKFYVGYISIDIARNILGLTKEYAPDQKVIVALEKKHNDDIVITYYLQQSRKNLLIYSYDDNGKINVEKKDPFGITVTEVYHITKFMDEKYRYSAADIKKLDALLKRKCQGRG